MYGYTRAGYLVWWLPGISAEKFDHLPLSYFMP